MSSDIEQRLLRLEERLSRLEAAGKEAQDSEARRRHRGMLVRIGLLAALALFYALYLKQMTSFG